MDDLYHVPPSLSMPLFILNQTARPRTGLSDERRIA